MEQWNKARVSVNDAKTGDLVTTLDGETIGKVEYSNPFKGILKVAFINAAIPHWFWHTENGHDFSLNSLYVPLALKKHLKLKEMHLFLFKAR